MRDFALVVLLLLAITEFVIRGPFRYYARGYFWSDMTQVYVPSRAWIEGENPYSPVVFIRICRDATGVTHDTTTFRAHSPWPITTLVIMAPLAALPWHIAHAVWAFVSCFAVVPMIVALASITGITDWKHQVLLSVLVLALAPFHTGIAGGNVSMVAIPLCVIAVWATSRGKDNLAGIFLALAACLKPQIGIWFYLYYMLNRRWRIIAVSSVLAAGIAALGMLRLWLAGTQWISDFIVNARILVDNKLVDFTQADPLRFTLVNLQVLAYSLTKSRDVAETAAILISVALFFTWFRFGFYKRHSELLTVSTLAVILLLPAYHRNYDGALLDLPLAWCVSELRIHGARTAKLSLALMVPFALSGPTILIYLAKNGSLPRFVTQGWWWQTLLLPHEIWLLLALSIVLLYEMSSRRSLASAWADGRSWAAHSAQSSTR